MGKSSRIHGSSLRATKRLMNSVFQDGWLVRTTLVPSARIILYGSAMKTARTIPVKVRIKKAIYKMVRQVEFSFVDIVILTYVPFPTNIGKIASVRNFRWRIESYLIRPIRSMSFEIELPDKSTYCGVEILSESDRRTNHTTQVEDCPEYADESSFLSLSWIGHHQGTLCGP